MKRHLLSINELAALWPEKTATAIRIMVSRNILREATWLDKISARAQGLPWGDRGGGRGGKRPFISIIDPRIPEDIRHKYLVAYAAPDGDRAPGLLPALSGISFGSGDGHAVPAINPPGSVEVPEKAKEEARAKADLVAAWRGYRDGNRREHRLGEVDGEFEAAYNSGHLLPALFLKLGRVSLKSLYRWAEKLGDTLDLTLLVPAWHYGKGEPGLTNEEKTIFADCLLRPNRLNLGEATRIVKAVLRQRGVSSPSSPMTFRRWAQWYQAKNSHVYTLLREGEKALKDTQIFSIKRDASRLEVGQVLVADGHRLNFQVKNPFTGKACRPTLVGYLDWRSGDLAGFDIMLEENTQLIASALRNAIIRLGKFPEYAFQDNGSAFRAKFFTSTENLQEAGLCGLYGRLNITPLFATPYNARAKVIERFFKEFSKFERLLLSFTGTSIVDKPAWLMRNEKFHRALHSPELPTIEQTAEMVRIWIEAYWEEQPHPHIKGKTIGQVFNEGRGPRVDPAALDDLMLAHEVKTIGPNGIRFLGADYYDDALVGLRERAIIKYSITDLATVRVYDLEGRSLCTAKRFDSVHPLAAQLGSAKDLEEVRHLQNKQKSLTKATIRIAKETRALISEQKKALPWADIVEAAPRIPDQLDKANIELPAHEEHIPGAALKPARLTVAPATADTDSASRPVITRSQRPSRPASFGQAIDRYKFIIEHGVEPEDEPFIEAFKKSDTYRQLKEHLDAKERKYAALRAGHSTTEGGYSR